MSNRGAVRNFGMFQCKTPLKHPPLYARKRTDHRSLTVWEFPQKKRFRAGFQRFPISGIPALGILGNYRSCHVGIIGRWPDSEAGLF